MSLKTITNIATERLSLSPLTTADRDFILELVNTKGWLQFIGERNVHSEEDALNYINKINDAPGIQYWVVRIINTNEPVGIITLIKRDYLEHSDIGFAFLPGHNGKGYAYEATKEILSMALSKPEHATILATTLPHNSRSIKLLSKLGLHFEKEIVVQNEQLHVYFVKRHA